jgi:hypothetical protein
VVKTSTRRAQKTKILDLGTNHFLWCLMGVGFAVLWTGLGFVLAYFQGGVAAFFAEWKLLQGFFLLAIGAWLLLIIESDTFRRRISMLTRDGSVPCERIRDRRVQIGIILSISILGTSSLIKMGFNGHGTILVFMWVTCAAVCVTAGIVTMHAIEIIVVIHYLQKTDIKVFRYAPASTPELRILVSYFSSFSLLTTIGYGFALWATFNPHWTGPKNYIEAVRLFWPVLYVPLCTAALIYPHLVTHRLIQHEKEKTLISCQRDIDDLLSKYSALKTDEINRTNTLAQLFDRISGTPNYVMDMGIAVRTILPLVFNLVTLFAKAAVGHP